MARPYSMDLRERVVSAVNDEGVSRHAAAARFGIAPSTAVHWLKRVETAGSVAPKRVGGYKPATLSGDHRDWLLKRMKSDFTLRGLVVELAERGVKVDYRSVWRFAHAEGLSFKKKSDGQRTGSAKGRTAPAPVENIPGHDKP